MRSLALLLSALAMTGFALPSCASKPIPKWEGKIYAGSSADQAMVRKQAGEIIKADSPEFDGLMAMTYDDFESFYATYVLGCKEWKGEQAMMSLQQAYQKLETLHAERAKK